MSKIKEFENIPDIDIDGGETLEEAVAECRALFEQYNMELYNGEVSLARCADARMVLLVLAHRSHHTIEHSTACIRAELLPTSTGANLDNLAPMVGVERMEAGKATAVVRFTLSAVRSSATSIPEGTQVRTGEKQYFATTKYAEIPAGSLSVDVEVVADEAGSGSDGILAGEINVLVDPIPYVASAKSISASTGGTDEESDDSFTRRIHYRGVLSHCECMSLKHKLNQTYGKFYLMVKERGEQKNGNQSILPCEGRGESVERELPCERVPV